MDTLTIVLIMVAMSTLLLLGAIITDRALQRRVAQRHMLEENPDLALKKRDAADAVIEALNRSGEMLRQTLRAAKEDGE
jgi:uncharacterized membrane protein